MLYLETATSALYSRSDSKTTDFRLPPRSRWELRPSGLLRSE